MCAAARASVAWVHACVCLGVCVCVLCVLHMDALLFFHGSGAVGVAFGVCVCVCVHVFTQRLVMSCMIPTHLFPLIRRLALFVSGVKRIAG